MFIYVLINVSSQYYGSFLVIIVSSANIHHSKNSTLDSLEFSIDGSIISKLIKAVSFCFLFSAFI